MDCLIIIISGLLLILSYGHIPSMTKYEVTAISLFYLVLVILVFTKICLHFMFRKKANQYGFWSIGGMRGFIGN